MKWRYGYGLAALGAALGMPAPAAASAAATALEHNDATTVGRVCEQAGLPVAVCTCIAREANSRFNHDQLDVIGTAMPALERITDDATLMAEQAPGNQLSAEQLAQLRQRAEAADVVIRQACGTGLRLGRSE